MLFLNLRTGHTVQPNSPMVAEQMKKSPDYIQVVPTAPKPVTPPKEKKTGKAKGEDKGAGDATGANVEGK